MTTQAQHEQRWQAGELLNLSEAARAAGISHQAIQSALKRKKRPIPRVRRPYSTAVLLHIRDVAAEWPCGAKQLADSTPGPGVAAWLVGVDFYAAWVSEHLERE